MSSCRKHHIHHPPTPQILFVWFSRTFHIIISIQKQTFENFHETWWFCHSGSMIGFLNPLFAISFKLLRGKHNVDTKTEWLSKSDLSKFLGVEVCSTFSKLSFIISNWFTKRWKIWTMCSQGIQEIKHSNNSGHCLTGIPRGLSWSAKVTWCFKLECKCVKQFKENQKSIFQFNQYYKRLRQMIRECFLLYWNHQK